MDCNCNCFGIAATSRKPIKRYNVLVPNIFPLRPPQFQEDINLLDASTKRSLSKLFEYLEKNLYRGPKISRRIARKLCRELKAKNYGHVQVAVAAYIYLLSLLHATDSILFANELVVNYAIGKYKRNYQPNLIRLLLFYNNNKIFGLGVELLTAFIKQQVVAEFVFGIEQLVTIVCNKSEMLHTFDIGLVQSIVTCLSEFIKYCHRIKYFPSLVNLTIGLLLICPGIVQQSTVQVTFKSANACQLVIENVVEALDYFKDITQEIGCEEKFTQAIVIQVAKLNLNSHRPVLDSQLTSILKPFNSCDINYYLAVSFAKYTSQPSESQLPCLNIFDNILSSTSFNCCNSTLARVLEIWSKDACKYKVDLKGAVFKKMVACLSKISAKISDINVLIMILTNHALQIQANAHEDDIKIVLQIEFELLSCLQSSKIKSKPNVVPKRLIQCMLWDINKPLVCLPLFSKCLKLLLNIELIIMDADSINLLLEYVYKMATSICPTSEYPNFAKLIYYCSSHVALDTLMYDSFYINFGLKVLEESACLGRINEKTQNNLLLLKWILICHPNKSLKFQSLTTTSIEIPNLRLAKDGIVESDVPLTDCNDSCMRYYDAFKSIFQRQSDLKDKLNYFNSLTLTSQTPKMVYRQITEDSLARKFYECFNIEAGV